MLKKILLNNEVFHFSISDLPCLIHGAPNTGSSLFTVSMMADFFNQGYRILFLSGYHMARDELIDQVGHADGQKVIFIRKEDVGWFTKHVNTFDDKWVILIKNFDLFHEEVFESVKAKNNVILSGDLDACSHPQDILGKDYITTVLFSQPKVVTSFILPVLEKFKGYLWSKTNKGVVELRF